MFISVVLVSSFARLFAVVPIKKSYSAICLVCPVIFAVTFIVLVVVSVTSRVTPAACSSLPPLVDTFVSSPVFTCSE